MPVSIRLSWVHHRLSLWAWAQPGSTITRHPTELYAAGLLAVAAMIAYHSAGRWRPGVLAGTALAVAGFSRLITHPLRPALDSSVVGWYVAGIFVGLLVVLVRRFSLLD